MICYRIFHKNILGMEMSGIGPQKYPGRWNTHKSKIIYTGSSLSLCQMEIMAHSGYDLIARNVYLYREININDQLLETLDFKGLPQNWFSDPPPVATKKIGDSWITSQQSVALIVPSAVVHREVNVLLNPDHPEFNQIIVSEPLSIKFDQRVLQPEK